MEEISKALTFCYKTQKTFNEELDLKNRVLGWKFILEDDYTVEQVLIGLKKYMKNNSTMPAPADIVSILKPKTVVPFI